MRSLLLKARLCGLAGAECGREMTGTVTTKSLLNGRRVSFFRIWNRKAQETYHYLRSMFSAVRKRRIHGSDPGSLEINIQLNKEGLGQRVLRLHCVECTNHKL